MSVKITASAFIVIEIQFTSTLFIILVRPCLKMAGTMTTLPEVLYDLRPEVIVDGQCPGEIQFKTFLTKTEHY